MTDANRRLAASPAQPLAGAAQSSDHHARLAVAALLVAALAVGCSPIFVRLSEIGPTTTAFYRTALGTPILALWAVGERARPPAGRDLALLCLAGFCFAGDLACWHWSIKLTTVANASLLANLAPILVTLGAACLFGERITGGFLAALAGAIVGSAVLASDRLSLGEGLAGDVLALVTATFYASYFLVLSRVRARVGAAQAMAINAAACSLFLLPPALLSGESFLPATQYGWVVLFGLALVSQVAGQTLIGWSLRHLPASYSAVSLLLQPVVAAVLAWAVLAEALTWHQVLGGLVILASIALARRASR
ncbi:MAG TPA: DMT family transporter [Stellaceae bacterium]|nr:DMT family transporter [Stellaceae bacterium]